MPTAPKGKTTMYVEEIVLAELHKLKEPGETLSHVMWRLIQEHKQKPTRRMRA